LGSGPLGLYAVAVARERGAGEIFVIGAPELRLDVARAWGASDVLDLERVPDFAARLQWVHDRTAGRGADILFQCANAPALLDAFEMVRRGGRLINIGVQAGAPLAVNPGVFFRGVRVSSVVMAQARHFYEAIEFLRTRAERFDFSRILSNRYALEGVSDALRAMADMREVKPVIVPS
jgi:threonine dehydrogenase-like Zn-dependent dehydrogenase